MKYLRALFNDKWLLLAAFFILMPTGFKIFFGVEGQVFLADPSLSDPSFSHTVLYMMNHSIDGAEAIILNRPYPKDKQKTIPATIQKRKIPIFWGGPIDDETHILVLKLNGDQKPKIMSLDKWMTQDADILSKIENSPDEYRMYVGHAKWQSLQYEMERIHHSWVFGAKKSESFSEIFSKKTLEQKAIWLKILYHSEFYKRQAIKGRMSA